MPQKSKQSKAKRPAAKAKAPAKKPKELPKNVEARLVTAAEQTAQMKRVFLDALSKSLGVVTQACQVTGVGRTTHYAWMRQDPDYARAVEAIEEEAVDFGESKLLQLINGVTVEKKGRDGEAVVYKDKPDVAAVIFFLKTKGKRRGYTERVEVAHTSTDVIDPELPELPHDAVVD